MSVQSPANYTLTQLKEKLREMNLSTAGNKSDLLKRLHEADPTGGWMKRDPEIREPSATS